MKKIYSLLLALVCSVGMWATPTTIYSETFVNTTSSNQNWGATYFSNSRTAEISATNGWKVGKYASTTACTVEGSSANIQAYAASAGNYVTFTFGDISDYANVVFSCNFANNASAKNNSPRTITIQVSSDGGDTWSADLIGSNSVQAWQSFEYDVPESYLSNFAVKITNTASNTSRIDDILLVGDKVSTFTAGQMKTYSSAVPFHVDGAKVYKAAATADAIALTEIASGDVPAGVGVILYSEAAATATISEIASAAAVTGNDLLATTTATTPLVEKPAEGAIYVLGNDNLFHPYSGAAFAANRAYLLRPAGAEGPVRVIFLEDEVTAVENVEATETVKFMENGQLFIKKNGVIYNAMGQVVK